ncbi:MAG: DUF2062 domain-containing protein [Planctomycetota bacterium]
MNAQSKDPDICCIIPVYNNSDTIEDVAQECREYVPHVIIVDDGSTDADLGDLFDGTSITVLKHAHNQGKGAALRTGFEYAWEHGETFAVTIDGDGQHFPSDIPLLAEKKDPDSIIIGAREQMVGHMPRRSRFGRSFSDFWVHLETGEPVRDTQSGFRLYPLEHLQNLPLRCDRYDFEVEVLVRASWAGLDLQSVPVRVQYRPPERRRSSFRPFMDNLRISLTHCRLIGRRLLPYPSRRLVERDISPFMLLTHPLRALRRFLRENASPRGLAMAAWVGVFLGTLPLLGIHMITIFLVTARFRLNKVMALSIQNLCMPPVVPAICIGLGYFLRNGRPITGAPLRKLGSEPGQRFLDWALGSAIVAPLLATAAALAVYCSARYLTSRTTDARKHNTGPYH